MGSFYHAAPYHLETLKLKRMSNYSPHPYSILSIFLTTLIPLPEISASPTPHNVQEVVIPGGYYYVGSVFGQQNYTAHANTRRETFAIMSTEVTYHFYQSVVLWANKHGYNLSEGCNGAEYEECLPPEKDGGMHPVTNVTWFDAIIFANALSEMYNLEPVYLTAAQQPLRTLSERIENIDIHVNYASTGYRLPDLAEWQIAARGGIRGLVDGTYGNPFSGSLSSGEVAIFPQRDSRIFSTSPVGSLKANAAGLYDMSGNVSEWLDESLEIQEGKRMYYFCGGSYLDRTTTLAACDVHTPGFLTSDTGFRLVRRIHEL
ncbi:SUMF1/EgtB/PvdO family nonheme iron enzyme [Pantoea sp. At-9b]|uniref:SUMF1/EgtB/PvdO family nonheme iron enzyme n=1 Tax=Pantoea sp. (strain At-9b) TaxID=592316 RepID=UPI0001F25FF3|nr:SUMF1/EgtB/PvdO family nonheme iron enzyme [Pantoea sp. At-9b]ADU71470.1 protein of unknown function DUF323 [Pantoea sp. At-9b]